VDDWIYYVNVSDNNKPYKIKTDGTSKTKISDEFVSNIFVLDDKLYYDTQEQETE